MRVGFGFDVHRLVQGRKLIIGGVEIPFEKGLLGHSDADVLLHAICDALLGVISEGDIGRHFPSSEPKTEGISSLKLLEFVMRLVKERGYEVNNIDSTVVAERPSLWPYIPEMKRRISRAMGIELHQLNIKATTTEGLGYTGRQEGIAAYAVACCVDANL